MLDQPKNRDGTNYEDNEIFYTIRDKADEYDDDGNPVASQEGSYVYAKKVKNVRANAWRYYIRQNQHGRFFNPLGMYDEHNENRSTMRKAKVKYVEVDSKTFRFYVDYLRTKNKAYFLNAERGV